MRVLDELAERSVPRLPPLVRAGTPAEQLSALLLNQDRIKVGLTGNLRDFRFVDRTGATVTGADVDYNGQPDVLAAIVSAISDAGYQAHPEAA